DGIMIALGVDIARFEVHGHGNQFEVVRLDFRAHVFFQLLANAIEPHQASYVLGEVPIPSVNGTVQVAFQRAGVAVEQKALSLCLEVWNGKQIDNHAEQGAGAGARHQVNLRTWAAVRGAGCAAASKHLEKTPDDSRAERAVGGATAENHRGGGAFDISVPAPRAEVAACRAQPCCQAGL